MLLIRRWGPDRDEVEWVNVAQVTSVRLQRKTEDRYWVVVLAGSAKAAVVSPAFDPETARQHLEALLGHLMANAVGYVDWSGPRSTWRVTGAAGPVPAS